MVVLWSHSTRAVTEMSMKIFPHFMLTFDSSSLSITKVCSTLASHKTILTATNVQRPCIVLTVCIIASKPFTMPREFNFTCTNTKPRALLLLIWADCHLTLECVIKTDAIGHVLVLVVAVFTIEFVWLALFQEHDLAWIIRPLDDSRKVHGVVDLVLCLENFLEAKIIMPLLQSVECNVFVVPIEDLFGCWCGSRVGHHRVRSLLLRIVWWPQLRNVHFEI